MTNNKKKLSKKELSAKKLVEQMVAQRKIESEARNSFWEMQRKVEKEHLEEQIKQREKKEREKKKAVKTYVVVMTLITLVLFGLGSMWGVVDYNYEIEKCSSMTSATSNYDFTHTLEIDADFSQHCFYYKNYPMALFWNVFGFGILLAIFSGIGWALWGFKISDDYY